LPTTPAIEGSSCTITIRRRAAVTEFIKAANPEDVKASYPKASILKAGRVVFNIKDNDYRLIARVQYQASVVMIRFFGTHAEYDEMTFDRKTYRIRINGRAGIHRDAESLGRHCGAKAVIRVECLDIYPNCPRYVPNRATSEGSIYVPRPGQTPPAPEWKRLPAVAPLLPD
jgi:mRNA-degrading endonuclease HigB of HigAB toxin-antitoxin module